MKNFFKYILQKTLGFQNYLYLFARFVIWRLPNDKKEKDFIKFIEIVEDGGHVLDVGANIGVMSYYFSKRLINSAIHSFEPIPENRKVLLKLKRKLKLLNVKIYSFALGDQSGDAEMIMPEQSQVYFHGLSHIKTTEEHKGKVYHVEMKKLDDIQALEDVKVNAIKMDVEDYEFHVLKGAENIIKQNRPLIYCELWDTTNRQRSMELIKSLNYKIFINNKNELIEYDNQKGYQNFFFIPIEHQLNKM